MPDDRTYPEKPLLGVSAAIWRDGRVLLAKRGKEPLAGLWSLPGGLVHTGERLNEAIARELAEETGITADLKGIADTVEIIKRDNEGKTSRHYVIVVFAGLWRGGEAIAMDDAADVCWSSPEIFKRMELTEGTENVLVKTAQYLRSGGYTSPSGGGGTHPGITRL